MRPTRFQTRRLGPGIVAGTLTTVLAAVIWVIGLAVTPGSSPGAARADDSDLPTISDGVTISGDPGDPGGGGGGGGGICGMFPSHPGCGGGGGGQPTPTETPTDGGGGGDPGDQNLTQERVMSDFHTGFDGARAKIFNPGPCRDLITGTAPVNGDNALVVLDWVFEHQRLVLQPQTHGTWVPSLQAYNPAVSQDRGRAGAIVLYKDWHTAPNLPATYNNFNGGQPLSDDEARMLVLLHEVSHLTGAIPEGDDQAAYNFNEQIVRKCLGRT